MKKKSSTTLTKSKSAAKSKPGSTVKSAPASVKSASPAPSTAKASQPSARPQAAASAPASRPSSTPTKGAAKSFPITTSAAPVSPAAVPSTSSTDLTPIVRELKDLRALLAPKPRAPRSAEDALESGVDSLRRVLSDLIDEHNQWILGRLIAVRQSAASSPKAVELLDALLDDLGAVPFGAESLDQVDPRVHCVVEERAHATAGEGLILETLRPGFRTGAGAVLTKADVAVSRRN